MKTVVAMMEPDKEERKWDDILLQIERFNQGPKPTDICNHCGHERWEHKEEFGLKKGLRVYLGVRCQPYNKNCHNECRRFQEETE